MYLALQVYVSDVYFMKKTGLPYPLGGFLFFST
jgi:hypothetical protein